MKERPILFSGEMVRALLAGRKTQTRRVVRICDTPITKAECDAFKRQKGIPTEAVNVRMCGEYVKCDSPVGSATVSSRVTCPYGSIDDRLWVKETHHVGSNGAVHYRADYPVDGDPFNADECGDDTALVGEKWRPSIFCRRQHSRITLQIVMVNVARLQEISEEDAACEGVTPAHYDHDLEPFVLPSGQVIGKAVIAYKELWESIHGPGSWQLNPYVWVIKFKVLGGVA